MLTPASQGTTSHKINRLPVQDAGFNDLVAVPYLLTLSEPLHTLLRLAEKEIEATPAPDWFSNSYTIRGITATGYEFMYGKKPSHFISRAISALQDILESGLENLWKSIFNPETSSGIPVDVTPDDPSSLTSLSLDSPEQFAMAWTNHEGLYDLAKSNLSSF